MTNKDLAQYPKYAVTGNGTAVLSNRISYVFDLHGPSLTVDTACSSSLVCFHYGSQSLQTGEADIAIVAGSALHFDPNIFITMTDFGMLSTDGRCRTFDADGTGYARGEGIAAVVLKRKSSAELSGDRIRAVVNGTGSNHDGSKSGLTLPNGAAQAQLIRDTYKKAGLDPADTGYFEAHGTGTKAGDPIEAKAIGSVFAPSREEPLLVGSVKSNVGHLEGASGLAGVIKAVLSIETGKVLPNMHFNKPNPEIDFKGLKIQVPTEIMDFPVNSSGVKRASVNSFGYGGSNSHVILQEYRPKALDSVLSRHNDDLEAPETGRPYLVPLTSHSEDAGKNLVADIANYLNQHPDVKAADVALSYSVRRSGHRLRSFVVGGTIEGLQTSLDNIAPWTAHGGNSPRIGFVFTGQGAQWHAMGRELIEKSPLFRQTIERCDAILATLPDRPNWTCLEELQKSAEDSKLGQSLFSQPLCAALQLALVDQLAAWGIKPTAVVGHSSGEIVAAYAAGALTFESAIVCAYYRGLYMSHGIGESSKKGAMIAVGLTEAEGRSELKAYAGRIALAAVNSPTSLTLSGDEDAVLELMEDLEKRKVFVRKLRVEQAFHSHHMEPLAEAFEKALASSSVFAPSPSSKAHMASSVTGRASSARKMDAAYWAANMTGVVRFSDALTGIVLDENDEQAVDVLVEIGAHPALQGPAKDVVKQLKLESDVPYLGTLARNKPAFESLLTTAGKLYTLGYPVDLASVNSEHFLLTTAPRSSPETESVTLGKRLHDLPTYSWNHSNKFWAETRYIRENRLRQHRHTILGAPIPGGLRSHARYRSYIRLAEIPWLSQHVVDGKILFPAAGYVSMATEAIANTVQGEEGATISEIQLADVVFKSALVLSNDEAGTELILDLQPVATSAKSFSTSWYRFTVSSFDDSDRMIDHCHGLITAKLGPIVQSVGKEGVGLELEELRKSSNKRTPLNLYYHRLRKIGLDYGENFRLLHGQVESGPGFSVASLAFDPSKVVTTEADECIIHPTLLDAAFHAVFAAIETRAGRAMNETFVPTLIRSASFSGVLNKQKHSSDKQKLAVRSETQLPGSRVAISNLVICDEDSRDCLISLNGLELTALGNDNGSDDKKRDLFFHLRWLPVFSELTHQTEELPVLSTLADLLDVYAHQYGDKSILHITNETATVREALTYLGGNPGGERRRFRSITPYDPSSADPLSASDAWKELQESWDGGRIVLEEPKEGAYDLVIVSTSPSVDVAKFVKPGGFVLVDTASAGKTAGTFDAAGLQRTLSGGRFESWQLPLQGTVDRLSAGGESLAILLPQNPSPSTQELANALAKLWPGNAPELVTFPADQRGASPLTCRFVISLAGHNQDVLFSHNTADDAQYIEAFQALVSSAAENIVWLQWGATNDAQNPAQAVLTGLLRTLRNEKDGDIRIASLDFPVSAVTDPSVVAKHALNTLLHPNLAGEEELGVDHDGRLLIARIERDEARNVKLPVAANRQPRLAPFKSGGRNLALKISKTGLLDTLAFEDDEEVASDELPDDHIEVEVRASALNFRDIAASMGIIDDYRLGDEAAGYVLRVGKAVPADQFQPGDRVIAVRPGQGAHRSIVRNPAQLCIKIGDDMDFVTAASYNGVAVTAYYSLVYAGRLQAGEYCLIHSAAGGVGQMAIQIAQMIGARVIATVGSADKRAYLKEKFGLTDDMIFSSRDASFVEGVMAVTGGRGCDVALNSLAGDLLHATWKALAPFGRMVEIGKRDIHENTKLDMDPFRRNVTYASVDLITMWLRNPTLLAALVKDCYDLIVGKKITPPNPLVTFTYGESQKAFRMLQMGKFFGKIVLVPEDNELVPVLPPIYRDKPLFKADKSYLLVGGLGGIGRSLSEWMFRKGAREIAFFSRSGLGNSQTAKDTVQWLQARGVQVHVFKGDVSNEADVQACIDTLSPNLGGVFQAAMVLRDTPFDSMSAGQWKECVYPKTLGTRNLHLATESLPLDFFVCFSSGSAIVGSVGQSNYAAANAYLDALMRFRRSKGLAGITMNVGVVHDVGAVAEDETLSRVLDRLGYEPITETELFYQIEEAVSAPVSWEPSRPGIQAHQILTGINLQRKDVFWAKRSISVPLYDNLDLADGSGGSSGASQNLMAQLRLAEDAEERERIFLAALIIKISKVLGTTADNIKPQNPLSTYGLDSIVAVEFRKWFAKEVVVDVPLFDILSAQSIEGLARKVVSAVNLTVHKVADDSAGPAQASDQSELLARRGKKSGTVGTSSKFHQVDLSAAIPLSAYQSRIWFLHQFLPDSSSLNFTTSIRLVGNPKLDVLQAALVELVERNGALRTRYFEGAEFTEQELVPTESLQLRVEYQDLSAHKNPEASLNAVIQDVRATPLDIENGEIMRAVLSRLTEKEYRLTFVFHHIAMDNASSKSFIDQITNLYDALIAERSLSTVRAPKVSYADFSVWQNKQLQESPEVRKDLAWWSKTLEGTTGVSALLPFNKAERRADSQGARKTLEASINPTLLKRLKRVASLVNATPFHFVLAAFRAFVYRYTGEEDLTILMIDGNRPDPELMDVIGFFVNTIPLRFKEAANQDSSFEDLLRYTRQLVLDSLEHDAVPFDSILGSAPDVDRSGFLHPLGQIAVNYQIYGKPAPWKAAELLLDDSQVQDIPTSCELHLEALEDPAVGLGFKLQYDTELYSDEDMDRFLENFTTFLSDAIKDHRQPVHHVATTGPKEFAHLQANVWGVDAKPDPWNGQSLVSRVLQVARANPRAIAITTSSGESLTYGELIKRAEQIALKLQSLNIKPGDVAGILLRPTTDAVASMLAAALARCSYLPLDPDFAKDRLRFMVEDSHATIILTSTDLESQAKWIRQGGLETVRILRISDITKASLPTLADSLWEELDPAGSDPFFSIYTSGTTGKPKGVVLTHANVQSAISSHNEIHKLSPSDRVLSQSSISFDLSVAQIWGTITSGATLLLASHDIRKDAHALAAFMRQEDVTITYFPATQFASLLEHNSGDLGACTNYRRAIFAGELLPARLAQAIYDLGTSVTVYNQYGPTETTIQSTSSLVPYPDSTSTKLPIGFPIANCPHYVLDPLLRPVPVGMVGEVAIGGAQVAHGYIGRPEANAVSFLPDPFISPEVRRTQGWNTMYLSGDLAHYRSDGQLAFHGRIAGSRQIKLRGYRIDIAEIENELQQAASQALANNSARFSVVARSIHPNSDSDDGLTDDRQLVAFIVPKKPLGSIQREQALVNALHAAVQNTLNSYMIPNAYQFLEKLPTLGSGKPDFGTLAAVGLNPIYASASSTPTRTGPTKQQPLDAIVDAFKTVLRLPKDQDISPDQSFFTLGGNSLLLLRLQAVLKRVHKVQIDVKDMFANPTPAAMANLFATVDQKSQVIGAVSEIDWQVEATLPKDIVSQRRLTAGIPSRKEITDILLTGVETPAGIHTLINLLSSQPQALIRVIGVSKTVSLAEVESLIAKTGTGVSNLPARIQIIPGSLSQPSLGLSQFDFKNLGKTVQSIYHFGSNVSLLKSYADLKRVNVEATIDIIRLAALSQNTSIHYLSSWSVLHQQIWSTSIKSSSGTLNRNKLTKDEVPPTKLGFIPGGGSKLAYFKTRWAAESLLEQAATRGLAKVAIYRASALLGAEGLEADADSNFVINLVRNILKVGKIPRGLTASGHSWDVDFVRPEYLAELVVGLSFAAVDRGEGEVKVFHVRNPKPVKLGSQYFGGKRLESVDSEEWLRAMKPLYGGGVAFEVLKEYILVGHGMFALDDVKTRGALIESVDGGLVGRYQGIKGVEEELRGILG